MPSLQRPVSFRRPVVPVAKALLSTPRGAMLLDPVMGVLWREGILPSQPRQALSCETRISAPGGAQGRQNAFPPKARLVPAARGTRGEGTAVYSKGRNAVGPRDGRPLEGRHSAFPSADRRFPLKPGSARLTARREGRMPSLQRPVSFRRPVVPVAKALLSTPRGAMLLDPAMGVLWREGILPSLAPTGAFLRNPISAPGGAQGRQNAFPPKARLVPAARGTRGEGTTVYSKGRNAVGPGDARASGGKAFCLP